MRFGWFLFKRSTVGVVQHEQALQQNRVNGIEREDRKIPTECPLSDKMFCITNITTLIKGGDVNKLMHDLPSTEVNFVLLQMRRLGVFHISNVSSAEPK